MQVGLLNLPVQCAWVRASSHSGKLWHERLTKSKIARGRKFNSKKSSLPCMRERREREGGRDGQEEIPPRRRGLRPRPGVQLSFHRSKVASTFPGKEEALGGKTMNGPRKRPSSTNKIASFGATFFSPKEWMKQEKEMNDASFFLSTHDTMMKKFKWRPP